ncbi:MAG: P-loop NTPase fold protein [Clostridia bacterium]|nr:P-loop NTPase fold protein [Clostridia bacterium]
MEVKKDIEEVKKNVNMYFKDEAVKNYKEDKLYNGHISKNIINTIEANSPPYNIALIGKWGTGKTSILNFVQADLEEKGYIFTTINAWKYEKDSIRKAFILEILKKLDYKEEKIKDIIKEFLENLSKKYYIDEKNIELESSSKFKKFQKIINFFKHIGIYILNLFRGIFTFFPMVVIYISTLAVIDIILNIYGVNIEDYNGIRLEAILSMVLFVIGIIYDGTKIVAKSKRIINVNESIKDATYYESELENYLKKYKADMKNAGKKFSGVVCIIDDMDRLNASKIVESLSAVKGFVGLEDIIFIVPYDVNIVKEAIKKNQNNINNYNAYELVESELVLNKLFQFKFYLPELIKQDMYEYIIKLLDSNECEVGFINNLFDKYYFTNSILPILIHELIDTPREAKNIINAFVSKYIIAKNRQEEGILDLEQNDIRMLAKLTVLENDYKELYDYILDYPDILDIVLEMSKEKDDIDGDILNVKNYKLEDYSKEEIIIFTKLLKCYQRVKFKSLINFLSSYSTLNADNVERLIYLKNSEKENKHGGKIVKEFINYLKSLNIESAKTTISKIDNASELIYLELNKLDSNPDKRDNLAISTIKLFDNINNYKEEIYNMIDSYLSYIDIEDKKLNEIKIDDLLKIMNINPKLSNIKEIFINKLKNYDYSVEYTGTRDNSDYYNTGRVSDDINSIIKNIDLLDESLSGIVKEFIKKIFTNKLDKENGITQYNLNFLVKNIKIKLNDNLINKVLGKEYIENVIKNISKNNFDNINHIKEYYISTDKIDDFIELIVAYCIDKKIIEKILDILTEIIDKASFEKKKDIYNSFNDIDFIDLKEKEFKYEKLDTLLAKIELNRINDNSSIDDFMNTLFKIYTLPKTLSKLVDINLLNEMPSTLNIIENDLINNQDYNFILNGLFSKLNLENRKDLIEKIKSKYDEISEYKDLLSLNKFIDVFKDKKYGNTYLNSISSKIINKLRDMESSVETEEVIYSLLDKLHENIYVCDMSVRIEYLEFILEDIFDYNKEKALEYINEINFEIDSEKLKDTLKKVLNKNSNISNIKKFIFRNSNAIKSNNEYKEDFIESFILEQKGNENLDDELFKFITEFDNLNNKDILNLYTNFWNIKYLKYLDYLILRSSNKIELIKSIIDSNLNLDLLIDIIKLKSYEWNKDCLNELLKIGEYKYLKSILYIISKLDNIKGIGNLLLNEKLREYALKLEESELVGFSEILSLLRYKKIINKTTSKDIFSKITVHLEKTKNIEISNEVLNKVSFLNPKINI